MGIAVATVKPRVMVVVTAPATKVNVMPVAKTIAPAVVHTRVSALMTPRTAVPVTPAVRTHVAVAVTPVPVTVFALEESTALKYLGGKAIVIVPPMGTAVTVVKPRVIVPVLSVPGTLSTAAVAVAKTISTLVMSWSPSLTVAAVALTLSVDNVTV